MTGVRYVEATRTQEGTDIAAARACKPGTLLLAAAMGLCQIHQPQSRPPAPTGNLRMSCDIRRVHDSYPVDGADSAPGCRREMKLGR